MKNECRLARRCIFCAYLVVVFVWFDQHGHYFFFGFDPLKKIMVPFYFESVIFVEQVGMWLGLLFVPLSQGLRVFSFLGMGPTLSHTAAMMFREESSY